MSIEPSNGINYDDEQQKPFMDTGEYTEEPELNEDGEDALIAAHQAESKTKQKIT